jgi:hypothetical protein
VPRAFDGHGWRDAGFPSYMNVQELSAAERQKAEKAEEARMQQMAKDYKKSVTARREADAAVETSMDAAVARASVIETEAQKRARQLGLVLQSDGRLIHETELHRRAELREEDAEGVTPEQREFMERYLAEEDEPEEDVWHDIESE